MRFILRQARPDHKRRDTDIWDKGRVISDKETANGAIPIMDIATTVAFTWN